MDLRQFLLDFFARKQSEFEQVLVDLSSEDPSYSRTQSPTAVARPLRPD